MIIKSKYENAGLVDRRFDGDKVVFDHVQDIDPIFADMKARQAVQNEGGFSAGRTQRYLGTIPASVIEDEPKLKEALKHGDTKVLLDFFNSEKGRSFCVNKPDTGRSGKIIIK
jgi:hypothetical protein